MSYQSDHLAWQQRVMVELNQAGKFLQRNFYYNKPHLFKTDGTYNISHPTGTSHDFAKFEDQFTRTFTRPGLKKTGALPKPIRHYSQDYTRGPFSPPATMKRMNLHTPKRDQYMGSRAATRQSIENLSRKMASSSAATSRPMTKRGRFNEDFSQHVVSPGRIGTASSSLHQTRFSKGGRPGYVEIVPSVSNSEHSRVRKVKDDTQSEKAESIKSKIIDAISKMDETEIEKLRSVLKIDPETLQDDAQEGQGLKADQNTKSEENEPNFPQTQPPETLATLPEFVEPVQVQMAQEIQATPDKSPSSIRVRLLSSRSKQRISVRSPAASTRIEIQSLEAQLQQQRKAREKLQSELEELKKISREISSRQK